MIKGLIFLAFYLTCSMSNIILPTSAFSQSPLTAKNKTPLSKIDTRLLPEINNATAQSMIVDLMVTLDSSHVATPRIACSGSYNSRLYGCK